MNLLDRIIDKILPKEHPEIIEVGKIFGYLAKNTKNKDVIENYYSQYKRAIKKSSKKGDSIFINIYLNWEDYLIVSNRKSKEQFRQEIKKEFDISKLSKRFALVFLDHREQTVFLYENLVEELVKYIINNLGYETFKKSILQLPQDSIFNTLEIRSDGISFDTFNSRITSDMTKYPLDSLTSKFKAFTTMLYYSIEVALGTEITHKILNDMFRELKDTYNSEIASIILKIAPEKVLDFDKWLSVLSKSELEKQVREKTLELEKLNSTLEIKVRERTMELEKAYEDLKETDRKKTEFISVAAHQLRTPLSGIKWSLSLIKSGDLGALNEEQMEFIKKSYDINESVLSIVNGMLDAQELSKGKAAYTMVDFNIVDLLESIISELKPQMISNNIEAITKIKTQDSIIKGDKVKIKSVLQNIIDNAIKYSKKNGKIEIELKNINDLIHISVKDTGIGIPEGQADEIFERFFRADNAKRIVANGSGLGLFIAKNIVEDHGGRIWFESKEDEGTTFYLTFNSNKK